MRAQSKLSRPEPLWRSIRDFVGSTRAPACSLPRPRGRGGSQKNGVSHSWQTTVFSGGSENHTRGRVWSPPPQQEQNAQTTQQRRTRLGHAGDRQRPALQGAGLARALIGHEESPCATGIQTAEAGQHRRARVGVEDGERIGNAAVGLVGAGDESPAQRDGGVDVGKGTVVKGDV